MKLIKIAVTEVDFTEYFERNGLFSIKSIIHDTICILENRLLSIIVG